MTAPPVTAPWRAAHVVAASGSAITKPVLGILGDNPTFFVAHGSGPGAVFAVGVLVVPPRSGRAPLAVEGLVALVLSLRAWPVHLGIIGLLGGLFVVAVLEDVLGVVLDDLSQVSGPVTLVGAVAAGWLLVRAYDRRRPRAFDAVVPRRRPCGLPRPLRLRLAGPRPPLPVRGGRGRCECRGRRPPRSWSWCSTSCRWPRWSR